MNYPLISEYIEAIKAAEDNFKELTNLRPMLGEDEQPVMTSGNFAVVFKMQDIETGKFYALKCFTKEQEGRGEAYRLIAEELKDVESPYLTSIRYLDKELFVDTDQTTETEFPVLLMDWVEGKTLDKYLRENLDDKYALEMLAYRFSQLAQWLIPQPFAHGDLKPDNILVREDGTLVLVDYDGMYVPAMKGQKARELGSPDFRHPLRTENDFDEHIDDFSVINILLSLLIISRFPSYWNKYNTESGLLFSNDDYANFENCHKISEPSKYSIFIKKTSELLSNICKDEYYYINDKLPNIKMPVANPNEIDYTDMGETDIEKLKLISIIAIGQRHDWSYDFFEHSKINFLKDITCIKEGCCRENKDVMRIDFPPSLKTIEPYAFYSCTSLLLTNIQYTSLTTIGERAFSNCYDLGYILLPTSLETIGSYAFASCNFQVLTIPENVTRIEDYAFAGCSKMKQIRLPKSINTVGKSIFKNCSSLKYIIIPKGCKKKYNRIMPEYANLLVVEKNLKYYALFLRRKIVDEHLYAMDYYVSSTYKIDPLAKFNALFLKSKF